MGSGLHQGVWQDVCHFQTVELTRILFGKQDAVVVAGVVAVLPEPGNKLGIAKLARNHAPVAVPDQARTPQR